MHATARWEISPPQPETAAQLGKTLGVTSIFAQILLNRGFHDAETATQFLRCQLRDLTDPFHLDGMQAAITRTTRALRDGESISLYGDYDVDGVTSVSIMKHVLEEMSRTHGPSKKKQLVGAYLPDRFGDGYGLSLTGIEHCLAMGKPDLLIVLDCGTNSHEEVRHLQARGVDVVIIDHHEPLQPAQPVALINHKLKNGSPSTDTKRKQVTPYCTAGLTFKFCHALLKSVRKDRGEKVAASAEPDLKDLLDLVALATVADVVPLSGENRIFVRQGLKRMQSTRWCGLQALMNIAAIKNEPTVTDCGFRLGPRLNVAGRLDSAMTALRLLTSDNDESANELARHLNEMNRHRQEEELRVFTEAHEEAVLQAQDERTRVLVLTRPGWHEGVIGIVASRLVQEFHLPTFVVALNPQGMGRGSGRGIEGFDLVAAVQATASFIEKGGGHSMAAGVTVRADQVEPWRQALQKYALKCMGTDLPRQVVHLDAELQLADLTLKLCAELADLEPCGVGNPRPLFLARKLEVAGEPRRVGNDGRHLKLWLRQGGVALDAIGFGMGQLPIVKGQHLDVTFELERNEYRGQTRPQMNLRGVMQNSSPSEPASPEQ
jgi:single-stranded-DNA-specific exonuclease